MFSTEKEGNIEAERHRKLVSGSTEGQMEGGNGEKIN